jgi:Spy/CpxP family protein refolding chaperone
MPAGNQNRSVLRIGGLLLRTVLIFLIACTVRGAATTAADPPPPNGSAGSAISEDQRHQEWLAHFKRLVQKAQQLEAVIRRFITRHRSALQTQPVGDVG